METFLAKRPKPVGGGDLDRLKVHEETETDAEGITAKVTFFVLLNWTEYTFKRTRKRKVANDDAAKKKGKPPE